MRRLLYLKATTAGLLGGVLVAVAATFADLLFQVGWQMRQSNGAGSGGFGAVSLPLVWTALAALVGFALVFTWVIRRGRKNPSV